jgi:hypothetical protein
MRFLVLRWLVGFRGLRSLLALIRGSDFGVVLFSSLGELGLLWFLLFLCFRWNHALFGEGAGNFELIPSVDSKTCGFLGRGGDLGVYVSNFRGFFLKFHDIS